MGQTPAGGTNMDLAMMAAGGGGGMLDPMMMDPMMMAGAGAALPNQCCTHGALHCTVPGAGAGMLPPIDPMAAQLGGGGLYDLTAMRTPHGGIKPPVKVGVGGSMNTFIHSPNLVCTENQAAEARGAVQQEEVPQDAEQAAGLPGLRVPGSARQRELGR